MNLLFVLKRKYRRGPRLFAPQVQRTRVHAHRERERESRADADSGSHARSCLLAIRSGTTTVVVVVAESLLLHARTLASFKYTPHYAGSYFFFFLRVKESHISTRRNTIYYIICVYFVFSLSLSLFPPSARVTSRHQTTQCSHYSPERYFLCVCVCARARAKDIHTRYV